MKSSRHVKYFPNHQIPTAWLPLPMRVKVYFDFRNYESVLVSGVLVLRDTLGEKEFQFRICILLLIYGYLVVRSQWRVIGRGERGCRRPKNREGVGNWICHEASSSCRETSIVCGLALGQMWDGLSSPDREAFVRFMDGPHRCLNILSCKESADQIMIR